MPKKICAHDYEYFNRNRINILYDFYKCKLCGKLLMKEKSKIIDISKYKPFILGEYKIGDENIVLL